MFIQSSTDKPRAILRAAGELLAEREAAAVTVDQIARRAGTTKATVYRYFESKSALLAAAGHSGDEESGTRDRILDAAARIIPKLGLDVTTMQRIADEAGVSTPNLYWYFRGKDDLLLELVERMAERISPLALLGEAPSLDDPRHTFELLITSGMATQAEHIELFRTIIVEVGAHRELAERLYDRVVSRVWGGLSAYIEAQTALGKFRPGPALARVIAVIGMVTFYNLARRNFGERAHLPPPDEAAREFVQIFLEGVLNGQHHSES